MKEIDSNNKGYLSMYIIILYFRDDFAMLT